MSNVQKEKNIKAIFPVEYGVAKHRFDEQMCSEYHGIGHFHPHNEISFSIPEYTYFMDICTNRNDLERLRSRKINWDATCI